jgi:hypothetical protein
MMGAIRLLFGADLSIRRSCFHGKLMERDL